jgi:hypothetical protein
VALDPAARRIVERWSGSVDAGQVEAVGSDVDELGPYGAALNRLMVRRSDMRMQAAVTAAGDDRVDHSKNLAELSSQIEALAGLLTGSTDIPLSQAASLLLAEAVGVGSDATAVVTLDSRFPRRG